MSAVATMPLAAANGGAAMFKQLAFDTFMSVHRDLILFLVAFILHTFWAGKRRASTNRQHQKHGVKMLSCQNRCPFVTASFESGVNFNVDVFLSLLSRTRSCFEIDQLLAETVGHCGSSFVLGHVAEIAAERCDQELADAVIRRLPKSRSEIENQSMDAVAALLRVPGAVAIRQGQTDREAGEEVIRLYESHFSGIDFSIHESAQMTVLDAALFCERADVVSILLEPPDEGRRAATVKRLGAEGRLSDVIRVMGGSPQKACRQAWLEGAILGGDMDLANEIWRDAERNGELDSTHYCTMLMADLVKRNVGKARALMQRMSLDGVALSAGSQNELVRVASENCREEFFNLLSGMQTCGLMPNNMNAASVLSVVQQNPLSEDVERMMNFLSRLPDDMDENVFSDVVQACVRSDRADMLGQVLERHWEARTLPASMVHSYGSAIRAYGCLRQVDKIWATWRSMRANCLKLTSVVIGCMVEALVTNGLPDDGYKLLRELRQDEAVRPLLNAVTYCSVLKGFSHQKNFRKTWAVYLEMIEARLEFSIVTFNTLIDACARCGAMSNVPELLRSMACQKIEPSVVTYCAILKGYCKENKLEQAFELLESMRRTTSFVPDEIMYNSLLDGCARRGLFEKGMQVLADMKAAHVKPTNFTLSLLIKLAGRCRKLEKAFELFEIMPQHFQFQPNVNVYGNLVYACLQNRSLTRAMALVEKMIQVPVWPNCRIYGMLIRACICSGDLSTAEGLLRAACGLKGGRSSFPKLDNGPNLLSSELLEVLSAMASSNKRAASDLARDLQSVTGVEVNLRSKTRLIEESS